MADSPSPRSSPRRGEEVRGGRTEYCAHDGSAEAGRSPVSTACSDPRPYFVAGAFNAGEDRHGRPGNPGRAGSTAGATPEQATGERRMSDGARTIGTASGMHVASTPGRLKTIGGGAIGH